MEIRNIDEPHGLTLLPTVTRLRSEAHLAGAYNEGTKMARFGRDRSGEPNRAGLDGPVCNRIRYFAGELRRLALIGV